VPYAELSRDAVKKVPDDSIPEILGDGFTYSKQDGCFRKKGWFGKKVAITTWSSEAKNAYRFLLVDESGAEIIDKLRAAVPSDP